MITTTVSIAGLERHFKRLEGLAIDRIDEGFTRLQGTAEQMARQLIDVQIYDTPPRGYDRTGQLKQSIYAFKRRRGRDTWEIVVGAYGGAGGRLYALYNERGTYGGRVTLESIMQRALAAGDGLIQLEYGDPATGLEPRPWTIPTVVMVTKKLPRMVRRAILAAEREATRGQTAMAAD